MPYEVRQCTVCTGWVNNWLIHQEDGSSHPQTFQTIEEAQAEIDEFLADIEAEIQSGDRQSDEGYHISEFQIVEVQQ
ncbi:hypothetical protein ABN584_27440 [Gloeocapsa sp. BRSZ]